MAKEFAEIDEPIRKWVGQQRMFFVSTAPLAQDGLVNCSPKAMDTFRVLGPKTVGYLDLTGSGAETIAHLKENGRIVVMMCAFEGPPKIFRFHGRGEVHEKGTPGYDQWRSQFQELPGARSIIIIHVDRIADSCGYSIPLYDHTGERDVLTKWAEKKGEDGVRDYAQAHNLKSLDGLDGVKPGKPNVE